MGLIIELVVSAIAIALPVFGFSTGGFIGGSFGTLVDLTLISLTINVYKS